MWIPLGEQSTETTLDRESLLECAFLGAQASLCSLIGWYQFDRHIALVIDLGVTC